MSSRTKPGIPAVPKAGDPRQRFDGALKETLETLTGRRGDRITQLATTATLAEVIDKINEILDTLQ
jgi:hypothetical protein